MKADIADLYIFNKLSRLISTSNFIDLNPQVSWGFQAGRVEFLVHIDELLKLRIYKIGFLTYKLDYLFASVVSEVFYEDLSSMIFCMNNVSNRGVVHIIPRCDISDGLIYSDNVSWFSLSSSTRFEKTMKKIIKATEAPSEELRKYIVTIKNDQAIDSEFLDPDSNDKETDND
jgi:hypothetical protein